MWDEVSLQANGSTGRFATMQDSPTVVRAGAAKAGIDMDGDGEADVDIPLGGKPAPVQVALGDGDDAKQWGFMATIGIQQDTYQSIRPFNLAPSDDSMRIFVTPAASVKGLLGETPIQVFDDNMDGIYGSLPIARGFIGLREGDFQQDMDSILIGESKRALPWSSLVKVGEEWYEFESAPEGVGIVAKKTEVETGTLSLDLKGLSADWLVVRGENSLENAFFDVVAGGKKGIEVPAGTYRLFAGQVSKGKRAQTMKALVLPSSKTPSWTVVAGAENTVELGAPFGFDFEFTQSDEAVEVKTSSIFVTGKSGESYQRVWGAVPQVEVHLRKAGSKKGGKEDKLVPASSQQQITDFATYMVAWFPIAQPVEKKKAGETVEVRLFEKKNKLFGKIESEWKGN